MDIRLALMCGIDYPLPQLDTIIHQPKIKEIALMGEEDYFIGIQCLCVKKDMITQDKTVLSNINNFQVFMTLINEPEAKDKKIAAQSVLSLLFPNSKIIFTPQSLLINTEGKTVVIDENNFEILQEHVKKITCLSSREGEDFNPQGKKAREIAEKLKRGRQRVAAQKQAEGGSGSVLGQYLSILTIGLQSMALADLMDLTMYQIYDLVERFRLHLAWDIDVRSRLAGATPDKQPDDWMKNLH